MTLLSTKDIIIIIGKRSHVLSLLTKDYYWQEVTCTITWHCYLQKTSSLLLARGHMYYHMTLHTYKGHCYYYWQEVTCTITWHCLLTKDIIIIIDKRSHVLSHDIAYLQKTSLLLLTRGHMYYHMTLLYTISMTKICY